MGDYVVWIGTDRHGYHLYVADEEARTMAHMGNADSVATFTREEAEAVYERVSSWDFIAKDLGGVVPLTEAEDKYYQS